MTTFLEVSHRENCMKIELHPSMYISMNQIFGNHTPSRSNLDLKNVNTLSKTLKYEILSWIRQSLP